VHIENDIVRKFICGHRGSDFRDACLRGAETSKVIIVLNRAAGFL
jgi:hypothetical protein